MNPRIHISLTILIVIFSCFLLSGQKACAQEEMKIHVVQDLDNYYSLSLKYDINIEELKNANPGIFSPAPGDTLIIPRKGEFVEETVDVDCNMHPGNKKKLYHIALLIPLYLEQVEDSLWKEQLDPENISELAPFRFIQFYHGFMMAADSLRQSGLKVEIHVYDVDHTPAKTSEVLARPEMANMDMIFGPFFKSSFARVAEFARIHKIAIINPLSARSDILLGNPYVFKLLPSVESQPAIVAKLCKRDFRNHNIILYTANKYQNRELALEFKRAIEQEDMSGKQKVAVVDYLSDSIQGFYNHASLNQPNLVIIFAENEVLPAALLSKLSELQSEYQVSVIGLPEWEKFSNIESAYLISLKAHIFMASYENKHALNLQRFISVYRARYFDEPLEYAFSGFDAGYYFLTALMNYDVEFYNCLDEIRPPLIYNQFHFKHSGNNGYDNVNWNVLQYMGYSLIKKSL